MVSPLAWWLAMGLALLAGAAQAQAEPSWATPVVNEVLREPTPAAGYLLPIGTRVAVISRHEVMFLLPAGHGLRKRDNTPLPLRFTRLRFEGICQTAGADACVLYRINGEFVVLTAGCEGGCQTLASPLE